MSYSLDTIRTSYQPTYIEANSEHYSQPGVRFKWQEATRFMKGALFDAKTPDPTGTAYENQTGGIYFDSTQNRFKYKGGSPVQWRYFGDLSFFTDGAYNALTDNGVARFDSTTGNIQGSRATLDDTGNFRTPGYYETTQATDTSTAFSCYKGGLSNPTYLVQADGKTKWGIGDETAPDTQLERIAANELGSSLTDAKFSLTAGDSRIKAQRLLGGVGNAQGNSNYRCPVVFGTLPVANFPDTPINATSSGDIQAAQFTLPAKALQNDDQAELTVFFQTDALSHTKQIRVFVENGTASLMLWVEAPSSAQYNGRVTWTLGRQTATNGFVQIHGIYNTGVMTLGDGYDYSTNFDFENDTTVITVYMRGTDVALSNYPQDMIIINGGKLVVYNY